ncbi:methyltransferase domain-containing protein [Psychrobacillus sp. FJAT-51614]|uniref:Methyltransferase domain-containing protein n=1 Tax=Psychrobacillus mangrovi TaxID=3117745 RepID=A0ABU8F4D8_9BACI
MDTQIIEDILKCMPANEFDSTIQRIQTEHRLKLAQFWNIKSGSKVLEIGCGQGDTTSVIAYLVGDEGLVHAIDIASPHYGSPVTLGDSINFIMKSSIGNRIKVDFETDVLSNDVNFPEGYFDYIVFSHCSWYLKSPEELFNILKKIKKWGKTLCFAEWDTRIQKNEQLPHFLSVLIQAQYECFKESSLSNIRTLFTPKDMQDIAERAGWEVIGDAIIDSSQLQDGKWEMEFVLSDYKKEIQSVDLPAKLKSLIQSEVNLLEAVSNQDDVNSLFTYTFIAK